MATDVILWGCGRWGVNILRDLVECGARVTVVGRSVATRKAALASGAWRAVATLEAAGDADGVVIATPAPHHAEAVLAAAALGCPVFCEKPLAQDLGLRTAILDACGERLFVMHKWRWHPGVERLAALAAEGAVGQVTGVRAARLGWGDDHVGADSIDTLASHDLSIGLAILGHLPPVAAARGTPWPGPDARGWIEVSAILADAGGPALVLDVSAVSAHRVRRVEVTGTGGSAVLPEPEAPAVELRRHSGRLGDGREPELVPLAREWPLLRSLRDFVAHCRGGPPPRATAAEGFAVVEAMVALRAALGAQR